MKGSGELQWSRVQIHDGNFTLVVENVWISLLVVFVIRSRISVVVVFVLSTKIGELYIASHCRRHYDENQFNLVDASFSFRHRRLKHWLE